jgi:hypothetical protein
MAKTQSFSIRAVGLVLAVSFTTVLIFSLETVSLGQSAAQLLKEGSRYQAADDTSDRAPEVYRQLIMKYPKSAQAEAAQYFLGAFYERKFFILEQRSNVQDWDSMNKAENELYVYLGRYPRGFYLADAYQSLAIVALRRGYRGSAKSLYGKMREAAGKDRKVYIFRLTWSPNTGDVIKGYCDTSSLASASIDAIDKESSFDGVIGILTNWAHGNCR